MNKSVKKPSVTELTALLNKPALINWANKRGLKGIDITKKRSQWLDYGVSIHSQIENYIKEGTNFLKIEDQNRFNHFVEGKEIIESEKTIKTEWFTGKYDLLFKQHGQKFLIDFKTNQKNIYLENILQLVGYSMAEKCDLLAIVSVPEFRLIDVEVKNREPYENILKALSSIYYCKKDIQL